MAENKELKNIVVSYIFLVITIDYSEGWFVIAENADSAELFYSTAKGILPDECISVILCEYDTREILEKQYDIILDTNKRSCRRAFIDYITELDITDLDTILSMWDEWDNEFNYIWFKPEFAELEDLEEAGFIIHDDGLISGQRVVEHHGLIFKEDEFKEFMENIINGKDDNDQNYMYFSLNPN